MKRIKSIFATMDAIIGIVAFLSVSTVFIASAATLAGSAYSGAGHSMQLLGMEARAQHSVFLIDRLGLNLTGAEQLLNYDVGRTNYSLERFNRGTLPYGGKGSFYRILPIGGEVYYLEVNSNEGTA